MIGNASFNLSAPEIVLSVRFGGCKIFTSKKKKFRVKFSVYRKFYEKFFFLTSKISYSHTKSRFFHIRVIYLLHIRAVYKKKLQHSLQTYGTSWIKQGCLGGVK